MSRMEPTANGTSCTAATADLATRVATGRFDSDVMRMMAVTCWTVAQEGSDQDLDAERRGRFPWDQTDTGHDHDQDQRTDGCSRPGRQRMIGEDLCVFLGRPFLDLFGLSENSFGSRCVIVIFLLALEMVLGKEIFHNDGNPKAGTLVPIAFPLIAGAGTLTTIMSLKATYENSGKNEIVILVAIIVNLIVVYAVLNHLNGFKR